MALYDARGNQLLEVYDKNGNPLSEVYDKNGNVIWTSAPTTLKVATYNVGDWGWGAGTISAEYKDSYLALQNTIFSNIDADVCGMQEWSTVFCSDGTLSSIVTDNYFDYLYGNGYWAVGSKIEFDYCETCSYYDVSVGGDYAKYNKVYFYVRGKRICLLNVHFAYEDQSIQEAQHNEILNVANNEDYVIICGDFNTAIHTLEDEDYINCIKPFIDAGYSDANCGDFGILSTYYNASTPGTYRPATDHIIVSPNITITNAYVDTTKLTDGLDQKIDLIPLVAELLIT